MSANLIEQSNNQILTNNTYSANLFFQGKNPYYNCDKKDVPRLQYGISSISVTIAHLSKYMRKTETGSTKFSQHQCLHISGKKGSPVGTEI